MPIGFSAIKAYYDGEGYDGEEDGECLGIVGLPAIDGVGKDAPVVVNAIGGKQSDSPYRADLLPPSALLTIAKILKSGADKYGAENWRKIAVADHVNHALVHLLAWLAGDQQDNHLANAACRVLFALDIVEGSFPSS